MQLDRVRRHSGLPVLEIASWPAIADRAPTRAVADRPDKLGAGSAHEQPEYAELRAGAAVAIWRNCDESGLLRRGLDHAGPAYPVPMRLAINVSMMPYCFASSAVMK